MSFLCSEGKLLSIIVVHFQVLEHLRRCLSSIFSTNPDLSFEVIIVDNGSEEEQMDFLKKEFPQIKVIKNKYNRGFAFACNQGALVAQGKYFLFLNPDTELKGSFSPLLQFMEENLKVGIAGCKMINSKGENLFSCRSFPSFWTSISSSQSVLNKLFPQNFFSRKYLLKDLNKSKISFVDWVSGSCFLVRKELFEQIKGFDKNFFMYAEDVDLCLRAKKLGWEVVYFPVVSVIHFLGKSTEKNKLKMMVEHHKSMFRFYRKHYQKNFLESFFVFGGVWLRLVLVGGTLVFKEIFKKR
jgi:hypothetical protein